MWVVHTAFILSRVSEMVGISFRLSVYLIEELIVSREFMTMIPGYNLSRRNNGCSSKILAQKGKKKREALYFFVMPAALSSKVIESKASEPLLGLDTSNEIYEVASTPVLECACLLIMSL
ncbi:hypothetical protein KP509_09G070000 [Ceratopteris richardii]|uniref:Uncharacterized protein n=1 Tax=Ceratopteris richardii TaxID=49495 RepID=A0A8T2U5T5_CERRI|nr:hypothetical protein KP509_09G070000 [Ceratopteris richardii]